MYSRVVQLCFYMYIHSFSYSFSLLVTTRYWVFPCTIQQDLVYLFCIVVYICQRYIWFLYIKGITKKLFKNGVFSLPSTFNWLFSMLLGTMVPTAAGTLGSPFHHGSRSAPSAQPAAWKGWEVAVWDSARPVSSSIFFFVSWSAVTILPCPLGSACRENPIIAEDLMQYLWTSWVAHLDMGKWGEIWNFQQSEALSPPPVSGSICSIMGSSFPELPWSRSGLASSSSLIFNISNIFPARAPVTAACFKSTN